jgi:xylose isomerase
MKACGGAGSPETRRKYYITDRRGRCISRAGVVPCADAGTGWLRRSDSRYAEIGIGHWTTHDTDVIPTEALGKDRQKEIVAGFRPR